MGDDASVRNRTKTGNGHQTIGGGEGGIEQEGVEVGVGAGRRHTLLLWCGPADGGAGLGLAQDLRHAFAQDGVVVDDQKFHDHKMREDNGRGNARLGPGPKVLGPPVNLRGGGRAIYSGAESEKALRKRMLPSDTWLCTISDARGLCLAKEKISCRDSSFLLLRIFSLRLRVTAFD